MPPKKIKKNQSKEARFKRCIQHLARQGKSTSSQWAICTKSVGSPKKKKKKKGR